MKGESKIITIGFLKEKETYQRNRLMLMKSSKDKWVVIKEDKILGIYETELEAAIGGHDILGPDGKFLIRKII